jgi:hypothetical protein
LSPSITYMKKIIINIVFVILTAHWSFGQFKKVEDFHSVQKKTTLECKSANEILQNKIRKDKGQFSSFSDSALQWFDFTQINQIQLDTVQLQKIYYTFFNDNGCNFTFFIDNPNQTASNSEKVWLNNVFLIWEKEVEKIAAANLKEEIKDIKKEIKSEEKEIKSANKKVSNIQGQIKKNENDNNDNNTAIEKAKSKSADLATQIKQSKKEIEDFDQKSKTKEIKKLGKSISKAEKEDGKIVAQLIKLESNKGQFETLYNTAVSNIESLNTDLVSSTEKSETSEIKKRIKKEEKLRDDNGKKRDDAVQEIDLITKKKQNNLQNIERDKNSMSALIKSMSDFNQKSRLKEIKKLSKQQKGEEKRVNKLNKSNQKLNAKIDKSKKAIQSEEQKIESSLNSKKQKQEELKEKKE